MQRFQAIQYMQKNTTATLQNPQSTFFPEGFPVQTTRFRIKRPEKKIIEKLFSKNMNRSLSDLHGRLENIAIQKPLKSLKTTRKGQKNIINAANRARIETTANETKKRRTTKTNEKTESSFSKQFKKTQNRKTNKASTFTISQMKFAKKSKKRRNKTSPPTASSQS